MLRVEMLPVAHGDALWIEWTAADGATGRMIVDGGPAHTYAALHRRIRALPPDRRHIDVLVVTHIDADHIEGIVRLLQEDLGVTYGDVWFNGWTQLQALPEAPRGPMSGEYVEALLAARQLPHNAMFGGGPILASRRRLRLPAGASVRVLSPTTERLLALREEWEETLRAAHMEPGDHDAALKRLRKDKRLRPLGDVDARTGPPPPTPREPPLDDAVPNGSSIAFVLTAGGRRVLLTGDCWAGVLQDALPSRTHVDAWKLAHHGSRANLTAALAAQVRTRRYGFSTNGAIFRHPSPEAVDLVLAQGGRPRLIFNHRSPTTEPWLHVDPRWIATADGVLLDG